MRLRYWPTKARHVMRPSFMASCTCEMVASTTSNGAGFCAVSVNTTSKGKARRVSNRFTGTFYDTPEAWKKRDPPSCCDLFGLRRLDAAFVGRRAERETISFQQSAFSNQLSEIGFQR